MLIGGIIAFVLGGVLMLAGRRQKGLQQEMQKGSVISVREAQAGARVELYGTIISQQPLKTPFSGRECVYYEYELERQVENRDAQGRTNLRWERVSSDRQSSPFVLQDSSGSIAIQPEGADMDPVNLGEQFVQSNAIPGFLQSFTQQLTGFNTRATEKALLTNAQAYVMGTVVQAGSGLAVVKGQGKMLVSHKTEAEVERATKRNAMVMNILGIILGIGGVALAIISLVQK